MTLRHGRMADSEHGMSAAIVCTLVVAKLAVYSHGNGIPVRSKTSRAKETTSRYQMVLALIFWHDNDTRNPKLRIPNTFTQSKENPLGFPTHHPAQTPIHFQYHRDDVRQQFNRVHYHITKWECALARTFGDHHPR